jgi:hypothetical protein
MVIESLKADCKVRRGGLIFLEIRDRLQEIRGVFAGHKRN